MGAKVGALTKNSVKVAVTATDATVKVSGYVADRVGNLTKRMASYLAAKVVDPNKPGGIKKGGSAMGTIVDAARGGLVAYGTVYNGLEANAKVLGNNLKQNSVKVVQHKYGNQTVDEDETHAAAGLLAVDVREYDRSVLGLQARRGSWNEGLRPATNLKEDIAGVF